MQTPTIIQLIPAHDYESCVNIDGEPFTLISWALILTEKGNEIVPVILYDGKPWPVYGLGDGWRVQLCSMIKGRPLKAPAFN